MNQPHPYPALARQTLREYLSKKQVDPALPIEIRSDPALWDLRAGCFVSIKTSSGALRGCIGTILPTRPTLGQEIMYNAISAGTQDPRFPSLSLEELEQVIFSVDVLSPPEPVSGPHELDPAQWGVIVEKDGRRGLLLPALEGVDTVEIQLDIAARKAGLPNAEGATLKRFSVTRYLEV